MAQADVTVAAAVTSFGTGSYAGYSSIASSNKWYISQGYKNVPAAGGLVLDSRTVVQNAGTGPVTVNIIYQDENGNDIHTDSKTLQIGESWYQWATGVPNLPGLTYWSGPARVEAGAGGQVVTLVEVWYGNSYQIYNATPEEQLGTRIVAPYITRRLAFPSDWSSVWTVSNPDTANAANITYTYTAPPTHPTLPNQKYVGTATVPAGGRFAQNLRQGGAVGANLPAGFYGTLEIVSNRPLAGSIVQNLLQGGAPAMAYSFVDPSVAGKTTVFMPFIRDNNRTNWTGFYTIMNVGPTTATYRYFAVKSDNSQTLMSDPVSVPAGAFDNLNWRGTDTSDDLLGGPGGGWTGAIYIVSDQPMVGFGGETNPNLGSNVDWFTGWNLVPGP